MMGKCSHPHGDHVDGTWVCGKCYAKMHDRPVRYITVKVPGGPGDGRQEPVYAPIRRADSGYTLSQFIYQIALRLMARGNFQIGEAKSYAISLMESIGDEFGDPAFSWGREQAWEIVREDMDYWDREGAVGNG